MKKIWKKSLALALAVCTLLSLCVPAVSAETEGTTAEEYVFPEFSRPVYLGEPLTGEMSITEDIERITVGGKDYLVVAAKGASLYVFKLTDFMENYNPNADTDPNTWIHDQEATGIDISRGIVGDSTGKFYVVGGSNHMYVYDFYAGSGYKIELPTTRGSVNDICIDDQDNLYIALTPNVPQQPAQILKVDTRNGNQISVVYETMDLDYTSAVIWGQDGNVYTVGTARGKLSCCEVHKFNPATGEKLGTYFLDKTSFILYLSYIDGVLFVGNSNSISEGFVGLDTTTMKKIEDIGPTHWIMGCVPQPKDGVTYMMCSNAMVYKYDVATRKATMVPDLVGVGLNLRLRNPWLENVSYENVSGNAIFTMAAGGATPTLLSVEGKGFVQFPEMIEGAISPAQVRTVAPGIPGIKKKKIYADGTVSEEESEVAVYVGGFLTPRVRAYCPDLEEEDRIIAGFSNGHAQTDAMIVYKDKIYAGCYSGGYIVEYDPVTEETRDLIPDGLYKSYQQVRLHALDAGDDKIFFGTIPTTGVYGGVLGWVDLKDLDEEGKPKVTVIERPIGELSINSVCYDEATGLLYACGSTKVGQNTIIHADEALMLVYDVKNNKKLGEYSCLSSRNPYSDMVWDLKTEANPNGTDTLPPYIAGIAQDPQTGKIWGLVGRTLFSMEYDPKVGGLRMHEEWANPKGGGKSIYASGGAMHWFSRPFMFDGNGYLYLPMESYGIVRFNLSNPSDNIIVGKDGTRIMAMGSDGNIYFGAEAEKLYMIAVGRVSIVKAMIDGTEPKDLEGVKEARLAYNALTEEEKAEVGENYAKKLVALEGATDIFRQVAAERVMDAIDEMGAITATSGGVLMATRTAYDALDDKGRTYVSNYEELTAAEAAYAAICAKTQWGAEETTLYGFGGIYNPAANGVTLPNIKYGHTNGALWEYAVGTAKFNGRDHIQMNFGGEGTNYLGVKVKVLESGIYDVFVDTLVYNGCIGAVYMFPTAGLSIEELYGGIDTEVKACSTASEHYVGSVDYTKEGMQTAGKWECEAPGEYIMVFGLLKIVDGAYARFKSATLSKRDPVTDPVVEMAKTRINAIGKVTKNSGEAIKEARLTFDALTEAQKELIYAPNLEKAEKLYAEVLASDTSDADAAAIALVQIQIDAIGEVTAGSGPAIQMAREAFDNLSKKLQKKVANAKKLEEAEAAFAALTANAGDENDGSMTTLIVVIVIVVLAAAGAVVAIILGKKKKKASVGGGALDAPQTETPAEETPAEETPTEETPAEETPAEETPSEE